MTQVTNLFNQFGNEFPILCYIVVCSLFFLAIYIATWLWARYIEHHYQWYVVPCWKVVKPVFYKLLPWICFIALLLGAAYEACAQRDENGNKDAKARWAERMQKVEQEYKVADSLKAIGKYVAPNKQTEADARVEIKRELDKRSMAIERKKIANMTDDQYIRYKDSLAGRYINEAKQSKFVPYEVYKAKKDSIYKNKQEAYQYKRFKKDSTWTWKKDSTSQFWVEKKEQDANDYRIMQEVRQAERDSIDRYYEAKKQYYDKRRQENERNYKLMQEVNKDARNKNEQEYQRTKQEREKKYKKQ